jgi:DNA-binding NarL/FixJ family response regulator
MSPDAPRPLVLLVEDEVLARLVLAQMLESNGFRVVVAASADEALQVVGVIPDIKALVTDVELLPHGMNGFELARKVHEEHHIGIVVVSEHVSPERSDLPPGAYFLAKPVHKDTLLYLVRDVVACQPKPLPVRADAAPKPDWALTPRQHDVLALLVQGKSNREIAEAMGLSENTVKVHLVSIYRVLGVSSRNEALLAGLQRIPTGPRSSS